MSLPFSLKVFSTVVFDCLKVEQRVDSFALDIVVKLVHITPELSPPLGQYHCQHFGGGGKLFETYDEE